MNSKKCLASLIDSLGGQANIRETIGQIDISGHVSPEKSDDFKRAYEDFSGKKSEAWSISIRDGEFSEISADAIANEDVTLVIKKPVGGRIFFASLAGFSAALEDKALTLASELLVLNAFDGFKTKGFSVLPWDGEPLPGLPCLEPDSDAIDPRKGVVRDLTGSTVPADPYRWMLVPFPFNSDRLSYQSNGSSFTSITTLILLLTPASFVINPRSSSFNNI
jgi:hypothetical protein